MEDSNVADVESLKQILSDERAENPDKNCLRKCLYKGLYLLRDNGDINVGFV